MNPELLVPVTRAERGERVSFEVPAWTPTQLRSQPLEVATLRFSPESLQPNAEQLEAAFSVVSGESGCRFPRAISQTSAPIGR